MIEKTIIRKILQQDNAALAQMIKAVFVEYDAPTYGTVYSDPTTNDLYTLFQATGSILWVAVQAGNIAGCCGVYPTQGLEPGCAELVKFYLPASARGKGIGKLLMEKSIQSAKDFGYSKLYLESLPQFSKAVDIYQRQGFKTLSHPLGNSGHTTCTIWMIKNL